MGISKEVVDVAMNLPKKIEEYYSDESASYLEGIDKSIQLDTYSCGMQSAYAILNYYGKARSISKIEKILGTNKDGTTESAIYKLFRERNLKISK